MLIIKTYLALGMLGQEDYWRITGHPWEHDCWGGKIHFFFNLDKRLYNLFIWTIAVSCRQLSALHLKM